MNRLETALQYAEDVRDGKVLTSKYIRLAVERHYRDLENAEVKGWYFSDKAAEKALMFFDFLVLSKGVTKANVPRDQINKDGTIRFQLAAWQAFMVVSIFGWKKVVNNKRRFTEAYIEIPKKNGKALSIETPIPTRYGWKTMGDLCVGDEVFDENGELCNVVAATDIMYNHTCYEVVFSDGIKVIADENHLWETEPYRTGRPGASGLKGLKKKDFSFQGSKIVFTTQQIKDTLYFEQGVKRDLVANHKIKNSLPAKFEKRELPINPYVLGFWLGDGSNYNSRVTIWDEDVESVEELKKFTEIKEYASCKKNNCGGYLLGNGSKTQKDRDQSITAKLRKMGLLNNKHIPADYLIADKESRIELLKGLMDTDGYVSKAGQCEFTTIYKELSDGFISLCRSLGYKPSVSVFDSYFKGVYKGKKYRIQFWSFKENPCCKLKRRANRLKDGYGLSSRSNYRQIIAVNPIESVPVRCIQVDSTSHLFLCSEGFIPTHNSTLASGIANYMLIADKEAGPEVYFGAYTRDQAGICFEEATAQIKDSHHLKSRVSILKNTVTNAKTRAKMMAVSHDADNTEGKNGHCVVIDEYHVHKSDKVKDSLGTGQSAREQPLMFVITTAGYNKQGPCYKHRDVCIGMLEGKYDLDNVFTLIYGIDEGDDWKDEANWVKANPTIGVTTKIEKLREEFQMALRSGSKEVDFKTKRLNLWVDAAVTWIPSETWKKLRADDNFKPARGAKCYGGLDLATTSDICSFALFFPDEKYYTVTHYVPEQAVKNSIVSGIDYQDWVNDGYLTQTPGRTTNYNYIKQDIIQIADYYDLQFIGYDRWNSSDLVQNLDEVLGQRYVPAKGGDKPKYENVMQKFGQGFSSMSTPSKEFEKQCVDEEIKHDGNPVTAWMLGNVALARDPADNIKPDKAASKNKIDGVVAMVMAIGEYLAWNWGNKYEDDIAVW